MPKRKQSSTNLIKCNYCKAQVPMLKACDAKNSAKCSRMNIAMIQSSSVGSVRNQARLILKRLFNL